MTILPNHAPSSKRPRNHDLGNDLTELNEDARNVRSKVVSVEHDMHEIKEVLQNSLDGISTAADRDWAFGGPLLRAANPGLTLPKSGIVGLPLSLHDVFRIRDEARGGMSDIDKPKLNGENSSCWTLSAEQFGVRNPAWAAFVKDFVWETFGSSAGLYQIDLIGLKLEEASESSSVEGFDLI